MIAWMACAFLFLAGLAASLWLSLDRRESHALAAAQAAGSLLLCLIAVLGVWWQQNALLAIAIAGAILAFPASLVMARLISRELE